MRTPRRTVMKEVSTCFGFSHICLSSQRWGGVGLFQDCVHDEWSNVTNCDMSANSKLPKVVTSIQLPRQHYIISSSMHQVIHPRSLSFHAFHSCQSRRSFSSSQSFHNSARFFHFCHFSHLIRYIRASAFIPFISCDSISLPLV